MTAEHEPAPEHLRQLERLLFFSDAVFAIVLTLLALNIHLPEGTDDAHLLSGVEAVSGPLIAFAVSFGLVGLFWLAHVITLRTLATFDWLVAAANIVLGTYYQPQYQGDDVNYHRASSRSEASRPSNR
jgi:uncharacterized membrane protein